jgi:hypothetical protein
MDGFKKCTSRPAPSVCRFLQQNRHETDMPTALRNVRSQGQSGKHLLALSFSGFEHGDFKIEGRIYASSCKI